MTIISAEPEEKCKTSKLNLAQAWGRRGQGSRGAGEQGSRGESRYRFLVFKHQSPSCLVMVQYLFLARFGGRTP